jgi:uncharacterized lipoprotein YmbA
MKKVIIIAALVLTGCSTTLPVKQTFPALPEELRKPCEPLQTADDKVVPLNELIKIVVRNYMKRHECAARLDAVIEWHDEQKKIFDSVNSGKSK